MTNTISHAPLTRGLTFFMALGSGLSVASNYYCQPLLDVLAVQFHLSHLQAGLIVTMAQLGYLAGLILLVPLGDHFERRRLISFTCACVALGLLCMGFAPNLTVLLVCTILIGFTSVTAQMLVPLAAHLASPSERSAAVGSVMSGLLTGILLARTVAGYVSDLAGWHTVYWAAAILMGVYAVVAYFYLPHTASSHRNSFRALYWSILMLFKEEPIFVRRSFYGAVVFAMFSVFWTSLAFMLTTRFGMSEGTIGLFGLVGAAGALTAKFSGRLSDLGYSYKGTLAFMLLALLSWLFLYWGQFSIFALVVGVIVMDLAIQGVHILNLGEIYQLNPKMRNRITTGYMSCYFLGGVLGSATSAWAYQIARWEGVSILGIGLAAINLIVFLIKR